MAEVFSGPNFEMYSAQALSKSRLPKPSLSNPLPISVCFNPVTADSTNFPTTIEVRADGYEPLSFEVRILPGKTITYKAELKKNP